MTEEPNEREERSMPTPFTDRLHRDDEDHPWRVVFVIAAVLAMLAFVVAVTAVSAAEAKVRARTSTTAAQKVELAIQRDHYSGRCGRGTLRACRYSGRPRVIRHDPNTGWFRFVSGYYQEWHFSLTGRKLYACRLTGWAYPGRPIAVDYKRCYRI